MVIFKAELTMFYKNLFLVLAAIATISCSTNRQLSASQPPDTSSVAHPNQKPELLSPKYVPLFAPVNDRSEPIEIGENWICTWRTVPSGEPLYLWINGEDKPILFQFDQSPQFWEKVRTVRFGAVGNKTTFVKVVLWPPGSLPDLSVVSE